MNVSLLMVIYLSLYICMSIHLPISQDWAFLDSRNHILLIFSITSTWHTVDADRSGLSLLVHISLLGEEILLHIFNIIDDQSV